MYRDKSTLKGSLLQSNPFPKLTRGSVNIPGTYDNTLQTLSLNNDILSKHIMLIGGTGCGKTNTFYHMVSSLKKGMTNDDVMIIFDTKDDFYDKFFDQSKDVVIGNSRKYRQNSASWNLFKEISVNGYSESNLPELYLHSREIAKAFFENKKSDSQPYFVNAATEVLTAILYEILHCNLNESLANQKKNLTNKKLRELFDLWDTGEFCKFISRNDELKSTLSLIGSPLRDDQGNYLTDNNGDMIFDSEDTAQNSVYTEILIAIRDILIGVFAGEGDFSIQNFVRQKGARTLFIEYDMSIGAVLTPIYRMLIDLALKEALGRERTQGNVYLIIDEFKLLPKLRHIQNAVNFGRSLGLKVIVGLQSINQLKEAYGIEAENIIAGFSTVMSFRANDYDTRKFTVNLHGKNIVMEQYVTPAQKTEYVKRDGNCVEDWDIMNLEIGEAIVGLPFTPPFKFRFKEYI